MKRAKTLGLVAVALIVITLMVLFYAGYFKPKGAGVLIETLPASTVYVDGEQVGRTPYKETRSPGEISIRLVPDSFDEPLVPYSAKVTLASGIETVIRREFGSTDETSSGEVLSFEKVGGDEAGLSVVSLPDSSQLTIDAATRAFTPYKITSLAPGRHSLTIAAQSYVERSVEIKTVKAYKLTAFVQLGKGSEEPSPTPTLEQTEDDKPSKNLVEILTTPTGFLRVRSEPSTLGEEVGQVEPGKQYTLLETDEQTGWFKVEFGESKQGWVSNQYAEKIGEEENASSPTPTAKSETPTP